MERDKPPTWLWFQALVLTESQATVGVLHCVKQEQKVTVNYQTVGDGPDAPRHPIHESRPGFFSGLPGLDGLRESWL